MPRSVIPDESGQAPWEHAGPDWGGETGLTVDWLINSIFCFMRFQYPACIRRADGAEGIWSGVNVIRGFREVAEEFILDEE